MNDGDYAPALPWWQGWFDWRGFHRLFFALFGPFWHVFYVQALQPQETSITAPRLFRAAKRAHKGP